MAAKLKSEIKRVKPFAGREAEVYLTLLRTAEVLSPDAERTLKPYGLTGTPYNVPRILRVASLTQAPSERQPGICPSGSWPIA